MFFEKMSFPIIYLLQKGVQNHKIYFFHKHT